ncbi:hypothetical protein [Nocardia sp. NPDC052566]|uniref:hypothetical protein n=1 Tax=Nocardia sp. NPDC052566 TaxID=3364330 RepID=UPI0037C850D9
MATYSVFISDVFGTVRPISKLTDVVNQLKGFFDPIARAAGFADGAQVIVLAAELVVDDRFLAVHFIPDELSAIEKFANGPGAPLLAGRTLIRTENGTVQTLSEVRGLGHNAEILAKLVFHECMHNKLSLSGDQLHPGPSFVNPLLGLASPELDQTTNMTPLNQAAMVAALNIPRKQWPGVALFLAQRRIRRDSGDPFWNL